MSRTAQSLLPEQADEPSGDEALATVVSERWLVATRADGRATYLCHGYRGDPAVTTDARLADLFISREAAEAAMARYVDGHAGWAHALTGWRVLSAVTHTTFPVAD